MIDCEDIEEVLDELKPYSAYLLEVLEAKRRESEFFSRKYHSEEYYEEVVRLNKILNLLRFLLKSDD